MYFGVTMPQRMDVHTPDEMRTFTRFAEGIDCEHLLMFDRVAGGDPAVHGAGAHRDVTDHLHESLTTLAYLAAETAEIVLMSGVIVLPQRQTTLVAKQAVTVDRYSDGRLRLGVGVGWNELEYRALGADFSTRGQRIEEQIKLLRRLWTEQSVAYEGEWDQLPAVGLNPLPVQQPIPIWIGGRHPRVLDRVARMGDGWVTPRLPRSDIDPLATELQQRLREHNRSDDQVSILGRLNLGPNDPVGVDSQAEWLNAVEEWAEMGATHLSIETINTELETPGEHRAAINAFKDVIEDSAIEWEEARRER